jgi:hypothetical protein
MRFSKSKLKIAEYGVSFKKFTETTLSISEFLLKLLKREMGQKLSVDCRSPFLNMGITNNFQLDGYISRHNRLKTWLSRFARKAL